MKFLRILPETCAKDHMLVFQFHSEHSIRQRFHHRSDDFDCILFGHITYLRFTIDD